MSTILKRVVVGTTVAAAVTAAVVAAPSVAMASEDARATLPLAPTSSTWPHLPATWNVVATADLGADLDVEITDSREAARLDAIEITAPQASGTGEVRTVSESDGELCLTAAPHENSRYLQGQWQRCDGGADQQFSWTERDGNWFLTTTAGSKLPSYYGKDRTKRFFDGTGFAPRDASNDAFEYADIAGE